MSRSETTSYHCDKCGKKLKTYNNTLKIIKEISTRAFWSRFRLRIEYIYGMHNDATTNDADLCQACAIELLSDALDRVKKGERASAGTETPDQKGWEDMF